MLDYTELGVGSADGTSMSVDDKLQLVLVHIHHRGAGFLGGCQEEDGKHSHLKLRTDTNESTAHWFEQTVPAELHVQDVIICIRLMEGE
ncbi:Uncharacterized protein DAT39_012746 [Clarias magur]|uniref:Uncharacterized protein n=1 Tax=Clarias magur TaxID=1594786 RepID=A0A8J4TU41_CLAMG|nr:Uncharacterized protein DAT39_012746 [Clarias magur]